MAVKRNDPFQVTRHAHDHVGRDGRVMIIADAVNIAAVGGSKEEAIDKACERLRQRLRVLFQCEGE